MKIIKESDPRYGLLDNLYQYNLEKLFPFDGRIYMCIPRELIINPVRVSESNWIEDHPSMFYRCLTLRGPYVNDYLYESTGLTFQELYDLLILHINETEERPVCKKCGEPAPFNGFTYGYREFCDIVCKNQWLLEQDYIKDIHRKLFHDMNLENNSDPKFQAHSHFMYFINNFDLNSRAFLYLADYYDNPDKFKFGVSKMSFDAKFNLMGSETLDNIYEDNLLKVSWIEYQLALIFNKEWILKSDKDLFTKLLNFYIKKASKLDYLSSTTISKESRIKLSEIVDPQI